jgi:amicyanin
VDRIVLLSGGVLLAVTLVVGAVNLGDAGAEENAVSKDTQAVATNTVTIREFKYMPPVIRVKAGSRVTWINDDTAGHTASSRMGADVETETIAQGERKTITLDKPGTYDYICDFHPYMEGRVIVE